MRRFIVGGIGDPGLKLDVFFQIKMCDLAGSVHACIRATCADDFYCFASDFMKSGLYMTLDRRNFLLALPSSKSSP